MPAGVGTGGGTPTLAQVQALAGDVGRMAAAAGVNPNPGAGAGAGAATGGAQAAVAAQSGQPVVLGTGVSARGAQITVVRDASGKVSMQPPTGTGFIESVMINNQSYQFAPDGKWISAYAAIDALQVSIPMDGRDGIATGLANLSRVFGARQERMRLLSNALASDANTTGTFDPVNLQKMSLESSTNEQLSQMQKKIFDSMRESIQAWLR